MIVHHEVPLAPIVWYRIGGTARHVLEVRSRTDLFEAAEFIERERPARVLVVGLGSNLLLPDDFFDGTVIQLAGDFSPPIRHPERDCIEVFGGATLNDVVRQSLDEGLTGLEWAGGLPGTLGAGVRGNVGAFGGEIAQHVQQIEVVTLSEQGCQTFTMTNAELGFAYRESRVKRERNWVVATATLNLQPGDPQAIDAARSIYQRNIDYRARRHPIEFPNCGSVFKNIDQKESIKLVLDEWPDLEQKIHVDWHGKVSMGYIIGRLGLAGFQVGGAQISTKHQNFIVNLGGACGSDVRAIIRRIQETVEATLGFIPEPEVEIVEFR